MAESLPPNRVPVRLEPYSPEWADRFGREKIAIEHALGSLAADVQHFGSTSVPGLAAKPAIDILLGTRDFPWREASDEVLAGIDYTLFVRNHATWRVYIKPSRDEPGGFHLHIVEAGSEHWRRHLRFRVYLRTHPKQAARYGQLKSRLVVEVKGERDANQEKRNEFIESLLRVGAWPRSLTSLLGQAGKR